MLADPSFADFQEWPADQGAPWVDVDGDGVYTPLPGGTDHPEFIGDQVIWSIQNDGVASKKAISSGLPTILRYEQLCLDSMTRRIWDIGL